MITLPDTTFFSPPDLPLCIFMDMHFPASPLLLARDSTDVPILHFSQTASVLSLQFIPYTAHTEYDTDHYESRGLTLMPKSTVMNLCKTLWRDPDYFSNGSNGKVVRHSYAQSITLSVVSIVFSDGFYMKFLDTRGE